MSISRIHAIRTAIALLAATTAMACSGQNSTTPATDTPPAAGASPVTNTSAAADAPLPEATSPYDALPEDMRSLMDKPLTGDLDEMMKHRFIRVAVTFNRTHYFIDEGQQRGLAYESGKLFEDELNAKAKTGNLKVHVVFVPLPRDMLYTALTSGKVDMVAAMVTVTPEREALVAFSEPTRKNVSELVVTGPGAPSMSSLDDLAGQEVFVRKASVYYESLVKLNEQLKARGKPAVVLKEAPAVLEDEDLLEMVNAGLVSATVVDDYLAEFWSQVFKNLSVHREMVVRSGGSLAVAMRKDNPKLREAVNSWVRKHSEGDAFRNTIERRYLENVKYAKNATSEAERKKFQAVIALFKKYSAQYKIDYLLMAAQGYQESTLDQNAKSPVGAIGMMQVMPATGKELNVGDITKVEPNINAGVKYMRFMMDQYFKDEPMDDLNKGLMTFASYNAGPGRIRQLRRETEKRGLNPNLWFGNVERIASERIGRETVTYVSNIYKYYVAYKLAVEQMENRNAAKAELK
ncbi:MAG: transporter substrate-binding domain-containing protein [Vicinamibacterales bacterium]|nr:transporter substrate-binding domain-containing protein [Vicinamibacterales bacterium]